MGDFVFCDYPCPSPSFASSPIFVPSPCASPQFLSQSSVNNTSLLSRSPSSELFSNNSLDVMDNFLFRMFEEDVNMFLEKKDFEKHGKLCVFLSNPKIISSKKNFEKDDYSENMNIVKPSSSPTNLSLFQLNINPPSSSLSSTPPSSKNKSNQHSPRTKTDSISSAVINNNDKLSPSTSSSFSYSPPPPLSTITNKQNITATVNEGNIPQEITPTSSNYKRRSVKFSSIAFKNHSSVPVDNNQQLQLSSFPKELPFSEFEDVETNIKNFKTNDLLKKK
jgi:hypothetical protein